MRVLSRCGRGRRRGRKICQRQVRGKEVETIREVGRV
jgi:hypothetical protein